ncbi:hypothetical protein [Paracidovorax citrulli]
MKLVKTLLALPLLLWGALVVAVLALLLCCIALLSPLFRIAAPAADAMRRSARRAHGQAPDGLEQIESLPGAVPPQRQGAAE